MYIQTTNGDFVLNPRYSVEDASYETIDDEVFLFVKNKKHLNVYLKMFFTDAEALFVKKVGELNQFVVTLFSPIVSYDPDCLVTDSPVIDECLIFNVTVTNDELTNSKKRSEILKHFVLGPTRKSLNFLKVVDEGFVKCVNNNGTVTLTRKLLCSKTEAPCKTEAQTKNSTPRQESVIASF